MVTAVVLALATLFLIGIAPASAQTELVESNVENGAVRDAAPEVFHLCFSEPVNNQDLADYVPENEGDVPWEFTVSLPDGTALGLNIVFESDGDCVDVIPGLPQEPVEGIWTFDWMVRSQETNEELSDTIAFRVGPGDPPVIDNGEDDSDGSDNDTKLIIIAAVIAGVVLVGGVGGGLVIARRRRSRGPVD